MDILKGVKLVVFDFDGTLIHLDINWSDLRQELGISESTKKLGDVIQEYLLADDQKLEIVTKFEVDALKGKNIEQPIVTVLESLLNENRKVAVFTRNSRQAVEAALVGTSLEGKLQIVGREDALRMKPHAEGLHLLMEKNKCQPEETLLIGDTYHDIEAARNAGVKVAIVYNAKNQYSPEGADYYIDSLDEIMINK